MEAKIGLIKFMKRYEKIELPKEPLEFFFRFVYQVKSIKTKLAKKE